MLFYNKIMTHIKAYYRYFTYFGLIISIFQVYLILHLILYRATNPKINIFLSKFNQ